jgi:hypothetical protein
VVDIPYVDRFRSVSSSHPAIASQVSQVLRQQAISHLLTGFLRSWRHIERHTEVKDPYSFTYPECSGEVVVHCITAGARELNPAYAALPPAHEDPHLIIQTLAVTSFLDQAMEGLLFSSRLSGIILHRAR